MTFKKGETPQGAKPFKKGVSGNPRGRPVGSISLDQRVRRILEGEDKLPEAIATTIRNAVGADRQALEAVIIDGLLAVVGDGPLVGVIEPKCIASFINDSTDAQLGAWLRDCLAKLDGLKS